MRQFGVLESGQVRDKALDSGHPTDRVSNCIHAVGTVAAGSRIRVLSPWLGVTASWAVLQAFRPHIIDKDQTHEWVYAYLGLDGYPITRRDYDVNPKVGPIRSAVKTALGTEP